MTMHDRRFPFAGPAGVLTLGLVLLMCLALAWSLDDSALVLGREAYTDFLVWAVVGGVLVGFIGAAVGWGRGRTYLVGAAFAALLVPLIVGTIVLEGQEASLHALFEATAAATVGAFRDLVLENRLTTPQFGHHLLVLGLIVWGSATFASFAVFWHRRPLNAVLLVGLLLVANMSLTYRDQLMYLVLFSLASLFLLIRLHTLEEQADWLRRRIGDPSAISGLYLRGGTVFITIAVVGSLLLTNIASSAPLASVWTDMGGRVVEWSRSFSRFLPQPGAGVAFAPSFGSSATITGSWFTNDQVALTVELPASQIDIKPYWRAVTYDTLILDGYERGQDAVTASRDPGEGLLDETADGVTADGRREVTYRITPAGGETVFAPQTPVTVDVATDLQLVGGSGFLAAIDRGGSGPYTVVSYVPITGDTEASALTKNKLRAAGTNYPAEIVERYAAPLAPGILGPRAEEVLGDIVRRGADNPYDLAADIVTYLQDPANFTYSANILEDDVDCGQLSKIECFAAFRRGYCQFYAAMMTAFLRDQGVPARIAEGYLPGTRDLATRIETVRNNRAHAWVEVYFPGYGWVDFDPTGGGLPELRDLPDGQIPNASATPAGSAAAPTRPVEAEPSGRTEPDGGALPPIDRNGPVGPLIAMTLLLAIMIGALAIVAWRRGPRGPVSADGAYGMVTRLAARFGFGPRPDQTVYEYAGALADVLPTVRPELEMVAQAKVEVAYGARRLGEDRLAALREAQRRLRTNLLRLALRRGRRGRRR
ncbi:MAG: transglutaminase domain-containing protein [Chloroflexota bacterium]